MPSGRPSARARWQPWQTSNAISPRAGSPLRAGPAASRPASRSTRSPGLDRPRPRPRLDWAHADRAAPGGPARRWPAVAGSSSAAAPRGGLASGHSPARYSATASISCSVMARRRAHHRPLSLLRAPVLKSVICWHGVGLVLAAPGADSARCRCLWPGGSLRRPALRSRRCRRRRSSCPPRPAAASSTVPGWASGRRSRRPGAGTSPDLMAAIVGAITSFLRLPERNSVSCLAR